MLWKRLRAKQASVVQPKAKSKKFLRIAPMSSGLPDHVNGDIVLGIASSRDARLDSIRDLRHWLTMTKGIYHCERLDLGRFMVNRINRCKYEM
jgi:hypothetical protein